MIYYILKTVIFLNIFLKIISTQESPLIKQNRQLKCAHVKCNTNLVCKGGSTLQLLDGKCCPECVCEPCTEYTYNICPRGFKQIKQPKQPDECCDVLTCISDSENDEDLSLNIEHIFDDENNNIGIKINDHSNNNNDIYFDNVNYHTIELAVTKTNPLSDNGKDDTSTINNFLPSEIDNKLGKQSKDKTNPDYYFDSNDNFENTYLTFHEDICKNLNCSSDKYQYLKLKLKCPDDSLVSQLSEAEISCCHVDNTCVCNECESRNKMVQRCKANGQSFEPVLVSKGIGKPGKCCDIYVCHSLNFTCNVNGEFYPNNYEWKQDSCTQCKCEMGFVVCNKVKCPVLDCDVSEPIENTCCPVCTGHCIHDGLRYENNESWKSEDGCMECKCENGKKICSMESCEPLRCSNPIKKPGVCCQTCPSKEMESSHRVKKLKYPPHCKSIAKSLNCKLQCGSNGLKLDGNRCPICECADKPMENCPFACESDMAFMPLNDRLCRCSHSCESICNLECPLGYEKDQYGCDICECKLERPNLNHTRCQFGKEGGIIQLPSDSCHKCFCIDGSEYCSLIKCKKPLCAKPIYLKDSCCPICPNDETFMSDNERKIANSVISTIACKPREFMLKNEPIFLDKCTKCMCENETLLCSNEKCSRTACEKSNSHLDECCQNCIDSELSNSDLINQPSLSPQSNQLWSCFDKREQVRAHGSVWHEDQCTKCTCENGENKCVNLQDSCSKLVCKRPVFMRNKCCPFCLDSFNSSYTLFDYFSNVSSSTTLEDIYKSKIFWLIILLAIIFTFLVLTSLVLLCVACAKRNNRQRKSFFEHDSNLIETKLYTMKAPYAHSSKNKKRNILVDKELKSNLIALNNEMMDYHTEKKRENNPDDAYFPQFDTKKSQKANKSNSSKKNKYNSELSDSFTNDESSKTGLLNGSVTNSSYNLTTATLKSTSEQPKTYIYFF